MLYNRWQNDFEVQRTFGDLPKGVTIEETTAWYEEEAKATRRLLEGMGTDYEQELAELRASVIE